MQSEALCTKRRYHYAIRAIKKRKPDLRKSRMAECLTNNRNHRDCWRENKKMNGSFKETPLHMDGTTEPELSEKYSTLYNSIPFDMDELAYVKKMIFVDIKIISNNMLCTYRKNMYSLK